MRVWLFMILCLVAFSGCRQSQQAATNQADVQIELVAEPMPPTVGEGTLTITVRNTDGSAADVARIDVRGDMNHAGMQPEFSSAETGEDGVYRLPFNWSMGGDWFLDVTVTLADGTTATERFEMPVES